MHHQSFPTAAGVDTGSSTCGQAPVTSALPCHSKVMTGQAYSNGHCCARGELRPRWAGWEPGPPTQISKRRAVTGLPGRSGLAFCTLPLFPGALGCRGSGLGFCWACGIMAVAFPGLTARRQDSTAAGGKRGPVGSTCAHRDSDRCGGIALGETRWHLGPQLEARQQDETGDRALEAPPGLGFCHWLERQCLLSGAGLLV